MYGSRPGNAADVAHGNSAADLNAMLEYHAAAMAAIGDAGDQLDARSTGVDGMDPSLCDDGGDGSFGPGGYHMLRPAPGSAPVSYYPPRRYPAHMAAYRGLAAGAMYRHPAAAAVYARHTHAVPPPAYGLPPPYAAAATSPPHMRRHPHAPAVAMTAYRGAGAPPPYLGEDDGTPRAYQVGGNQRQLQVQRVANHAASMLHVPCRTLCVNRKQVLASSW